MAYREDIIFHNVPFLQVAAALNPVLERAREPDPDILLLPFCTLRERLIEEPTMGSKILSCHIEPTLIILIQQGGL